MHRAFTLLELLMVIAVIGILASASIAGASKAMKRCKKIVAKVEFMHFAKTVRYLDEPDPRIIDPETGREMYYTTDKHFTNYLFTIEKW